MTDKLELPFELFEEGSTESQALSSPENFSFTSLEAIRRRLLDLSGRNSLLNFKHPKSSSVRIIDELPDQIYTVLESGAKFTLIPVTEPTEQELINAYWKRVLQTNAFGYNKN